MKIYNCPDGRGNAFLRLAPHLPHFRGGTMDVLSHVAMSLQESIGAVYSVPGWGKSGVAG